MVLPSFSATPPPSLAVPVIGINSNIVVNDVEFHVQTEDLGPRHGQLVTHVFRDGGCVVKSIKLDYSQHLDKPNLHSVLPRVMKAHHTKVLRSLQQNRLDSIPPCVTMHRNVSDNTPRLADIAREAGIRDLPAQSEAPSTVRSHAEGGVEDVQVGSAPRSTAGVWDRLVQEAHREHPIGLTRNEPKAPFSAWDRALESTRHGTLDEPGANDTTPASAAEKAFADGLNEMDAADYFAAVTSLAHAVQLVPANREYRDALRKALDWLDQHA